MIAKKIHALFHPEVYHGWGKTKSYFEGWYFKMVSKDQKHAFAVIPGIALDENKEGHSFIQVLDGSNGKATYHKFEIGDFNITPYQFNLDLAGNHFSAEELQIDLENFKVDIEMKGHRPWSNQWYSPGIMGPFSFVPFMQCYHGILSMNHELTGTIDYKGEQINMDNGKGYMEKDWGSSFPSGYIWMQSNHFTESQVSIKSSVARIPWLYSSFTGCIAGVLLGDRIIEFTTYNFTRLRKCEVSDQTVQLVYENNKHLLEIEARRDKSTILAAPIKGFMDGRIEESMTSSIKVYLKDKRTNQVLLEDIGSCAGLEVAGDISTLLV